MIERMGTGGQTRLGKGARQSTARARIVRGVAGYVLALAVSAVFAPRVAGEPPQPTVVSASAVRFPEVTPQAEVILTPAPLLCAEPVLSGPVMTDSSLQTPFSEAQPDATDEPLPINLATALRLSDARPLIVAAAQAQIQIAAAELEKTRVLWLPDINAGSAYVLHTGGNQDPVNGSLLTNTTNFFYAGGSLGLRVATTDAIFEPLAARQELRARNISLQAARNEALLATAEAYFSVQQARGSYGAMLDAVNKGTKLVRHIEALAKGLAPRDEIYRSRTLLAELEQAASLSQQQWRVASARLTRILRLNPQTVITPLEPDHLQVTLISQQASVDELIPIGLTNRPELAANQALVQATLARLKQEKMRPLIPSILITGNGTPDFLYQGGVFGTGGGGGPDQWAGRSDISAQVVWKVDNLGFGNQALIRQRRGESNLAMVRLYEVQDRVAAEVFQAKAEVTSAAYRVVQAEKGVKEGLASFEGNMRGVGQTTRFGDLLMLVNRPQEVVAALQQLQQAYLSYYSTVAEFNRAQFRLFYSLGFPARILACQNTPGTPQSIDTNRPTYLPPVNVCPPCNYR